MLLLSLLHFGCQMLRIQILRKDSIWLRCFLETFVKYEATNFEIIIAFLQVEDFIWVKVFKNGPSKIYGRQPFEVIWSS